MLLTILSQLKNKSTNKKNKSNNTSNNANFTSIKNSKKNNNKKNKSKDKQKDNKHLKKQKKKKIGFLGSSESPKRKFYDILNSYINSPQFFLLCIIFVVMLIRSTSMITSKTLYLDGHFEYLSETESIFIPDCTKMKKNEFLKDKKVGDILFYNYNEDSDSWKINNKKGLKLQVIEENDYYIFFKILNLENTIINTNTLKEFSIYNMSNIKVPLKHSFGTYEIYFSMNDSVNVLRKKYNIEKEE